MAPVPPRLKQRADFLRVAARGRKLPLPGMVLQVLPTDAGRPLRAGFTVTKKVGNAVVRNRTRRRLREALRHIAQTSPLAGADIVLVGRDATRRLDFAALTTDLRAALRKAGIG